MRDEEQLKDKRKLLKVKFKFCYRITIMMVTNLKMEHYLPKLSKPLRGRKSSVDIRKNVKEKYFPQSVASNYPFWTIKMYRRRREEDIEFDRT